MGCIDTITYDKFPKQKDENYKYPEFKVGSRVEVCYHFDTSKCHYGTIVRDDLEEPFETIIKLDNGRYLRAVECQYSYIDEEVSDDADVCEWIKYDYRTICPKNHDANNPYWRIPDNMDKLKYCPYCGKKIKVKKIKVANFNDKHIVGNSEDTLVNLIHKVMNGKYDDL